MSNWDRNQSSNDSYQMQYYGDYYQPQVQSNPPQYYTNPYPPVYNPVMMNGGAQVYNSGNSYQSSYPTPSSSAQEFFRMFQQQQSHQQPQSSHQVDRNFPRNQDFDSNSQEYNIPTMVYQSSNSSSGPPVEKSGGGLLKKKSGPDSGGVGRRSSGAGAGGGGSGRFSSGSRSNFFNSSSNYSGSGGSRHNGAIPKQQQQMTAAAVGGSTPSSSTGYGGGSRRKSGQPPQKKSDRTAEYHRDQATRPRDHRTWAAVPNGDFENGTKRDDTGETKPPSHQYNKRSKQYPTNQQPRSNSRPHSNYSRDNGRSSNGLGKSSYEKDWRAKPKSAGRGEECQRERLTSGLYSGALECLVCCERMRQADSVWSCPACHHVLHLKCTIRWASSSRAEAGWRCPACQNVTPAIPTDYKCMCGKVTNPQWVRGETPHTCGQVCGKERGCPHSCTLLCHPGPCPPCSANVDRYCGCGRTKQVVQCSSKVELACEATCEKPLNCTTHRCDQPCHSGPCQTCQEKIHQKCHCGKEERTVDCSRPHMETSYSCTGTCSKQLSCGRHSCPVSCHPGDCSPCPLSPTSLTSCPCGSLRLSAGSRRSCADPIPLCGAICGKPLSCGPPGKRHRCSSKCHLEECPPCPLTTGVMCRCGAMAKEIPCAELDSRPDDARCSKRCTKKRSCGRHKCNQNCCIEIDHICPLICNKTLSCGRHKCTELCHRGNCRHCLAASFTELSCECGKSVLYPPVPCGTRPPECKAPCSRVHPCGHPPTHLCHSQPACPPCSVLTTRYCFGAHELRKTVPCHMGDFSCGRACGKPLECGHSCVKLCHDGPCLPGESRCSQPCTLPRPLCGHPCAAVCHPGSLCSPSPCQAKVEVRCECGRRVVMRSCSENNSEYQRLATAALASKMAEVAIGKTIDLRSKPTRPVLKLECSEECKLAERNLRLAIGLQISNPDLSSKLQPRYSQFLVTWAKKDPKFVQHVHDKLTEVVQLAKTSKQKSRSYSFPSMKSEKRQFIHEYSDHFGVESVAYDAEPNRNVVATAYKDKSWLPSYSLLETLERAAGKRKVPSLLPSLKKDSKEEESVMVPVRLRPKSEESAATAAGGGSGAVSSSRTDETSPPIDYFDYVNPSTAATS